MSTINANSQSSPARQGQEGRQLREAEQFYEQILERDHDQFNALYQLGLIRLQQNRFADAAALFGPAIKIDKTSAGAQHHLAIALTGLDRFDDAAAHYRKALNLNPQDAAAHNNFAYVPQKRDRHKAAVEHCRKALAINPDYPEALNNLGNALQSLDRTAEAIENYRAALRLRPNYAQAYNNLASALAASHLHEEAIEACHKAIALTPAGPEPYINLANCLGALERPQEALTFYQKALAIDHGSAEAHARAGFILFHLGRIADAIASCQQALNIDPEHIGARNNLGFALRAIGRVEQAIDLFKKTIAASPRTATRLYYNLASSKRIAASDPDFAAMKRLAKDVGSFKLEDQIGLHFALGKAYTDVGDHARAFKELAKGNALKRRQFMGYDEAKMLRRFERISEAFSAGLLRQKAGAGNRSPVPVFIIGMPRSGTSLVEQILASHPKVFGAGERYELGDLADAIEGKNGAEFPEAVASMSSAELNALGTNYVTAMRALAPDAARIIDKMPGNFFNAGFLHLALPNARIIHTRRDPRDTALSCFSILFALGHAYTYDLGELGRYIAAYQRLMEHWRQVLPDGAMLEVQYEELVGDLETEARRIVEFCGLGWDAACLSFYKTERPVRTASVIQVRQPIYPSSVGRWRAYEKELQPFLIAWAQA
ncbi:MAG: sulfotransferase [Xanthobacteraceae bacterium]